MTTGFHVCMNFFLLQESFTAALKRSPFACSLRTRTTTLIGRDTAPPPATLNTPQTRVPARIGPAQSRVGNRPVHPTIRQSFMKSSFCHKKLIFTGSLRKENFWNFPPERLLPKSSWIYLELHSHPPEFQLPLGVISFRWNSALQMRLSIPKLRQCRQCRMWMKQDELLFIDTRTKRRLMPGRSGGAERRLTRPLRGHGSCSCK